MLQLISAYNMKYESVLNYYYSYSRFSRYKEITSFAVLNAKNVEDYVECISLYEKNLYYLVDDTNPNYILGHGLLNIRSSKDNLQDYATIAYGVRKSRRREGFGTYILEALLPIAEDLNLDEVVITCLPTNIGSRKVIENNNATFTGTYIDRHSGEELLEYKIPIKKQIKARH